MIIKGIVHTHVNAGNVSIGEFAKKMLNYSFKSAPGYVIHQAVQQKNTEGDAKELVNDCSGRMDVGEKN